MIGWIQKTRKSHVTICNTYIYNISVSLAHVLTINNKNLGSCILTRPHCFLYFLMLLFWNSTRRVSGVCLCSTPQTSVLLVVQDEAGQFASLLQKKKKKNFLKAKRNVRGEDGILIRKHEERLVVSSLFWNSCASFSPWNKFNTFALDAEMRRKWQGSSSLLQSTPSYKTPWKVNCADVFAFQS